LRALCAGAFAFLATNTLFSFAQAQEYVVQSLPFLLLFCLIAWQMWLFANEKLWERPHRRTTVAALALALCFSLLAAVGRPLHETGKLVFSWRQVVHMGGLASLLFVLLWRLLHWTTRRTVDDNTRKESLQQPAPSSRPLLFCLLALGLLLCWLPAFLLLYPGVLSFDSIAQMHQVAGLVPLDDWHPVIHTWLIAACVKAGQFFGLHIMAATALYSLAQMLFMAAACAYAAVSMLRMGVRPLLVGIVYAFFMLFPVNAVYSVTMWKDIPHAGVTLLLVTCLLQWTRDPKALFDSWPRAAAAVLLLFLFSTLRHNALYAYVLFVPFFLWRFRGYWKRALLLCLSVFALIGVYRAGLSLLKVVPTQSVETLSVPLQFAARVVRDHRDTLPVGEEEILGEILPVDELHRIYNPKVADPVKEAFDRDTFAADPGRYAASFVRLAGRYPGVLAESFLLGNYGYWYPGTSGYWIIWYTIYGNDLGISRDSILFSAEPLRQLEIALREVPGVSMLFSIGIMVWMLALAAAICWVNRRGAWPVFALLLGLWLSLLFSPVFAEYRYAYALVLCAPVCLCAMMDNKGEAPWTKSRC